MRRLRRGTLPERVLEELTRFQGELNVGIKRRRKKTAFVDERWRAHRKTVALACVQATLRAMASGLERCMFCEDSRGCDIEHREPRSRAPSKTFEWENLLWACAACNRAKASSTVAVIDPTREDPLDCLRLSFATGDLIAFDECPDAVVFMGSPLGQALNTATLRAGRVDAYEALRRLLIEWARRAEKGEDVAAQNIRAAICRAPFSSVLAAVLVAAQQPGAADVLDAQLVAVLARFDEIQRWLDCADEVRVDAARIECDAMASKIRARPRAGSS